MKFELVIEAPQLARLNDIAAAHAERAAEWWGESLAAAHDLISPADRRAALAQLREERKLRRGTGEHFDTRSALVAFYVRAELERRGWAGRSWRPVPPGEAELPGRRWGVPNDGTRTADLSVSLPDEDGELLRRATWHVSAPATRRLQQIAKMAGGLPRPVRDEQARLRGEVVTTADVIRAAVEAVLAAEHPTS
ncbi:hypothetical protein L3Q65_00300 (plasmid) [Amycolatopsis sp. FU40]|uniref:hypothetical protein n=1 Tax=Amycolatopsis sp. FU40 TaxID=2914159 RepID=UPI001F181FB7|nr:hypothetical protein [Amycolatopsis sp. FU40]UKD50740.1 hypothetical protein L3Q65_00300 [Amycolatopsis sp. FU40]